MTSTAIHPNYTVGTWTVDESHSRVGFSVKHLMISKVRGAFEKFSATIVTADTLADSTLTASVDVASINTGNADRDGHLQNNDFFNAPEFPTMDFTSTSIAVDGDDITVVGNLTLRGVTKEIELKGEIGGVVDDPFGQTKAGVAVTGVINREDFGVTYNAALETGGVMLGTKITLDFELQFVLQK